MTDDTYFIFSSHSLRFAFRATAIRETLRLPEITLLEEIPPLVAGVVNLRGKIIPILDFDLCFGRSGRRYALTDYVIVIGSEEGAAGVAVSDIHDVVAIPPAEIEAAEWGEAGGGTGLCLITAEAKVGEEIVMIVNHEKLLELAFSPSQPGSAGCRFSPEATPQERELFHRRAMELLVTPDREEVAGRMALAVIVLGEEFFGVELTAVREFSMVKNLAPVPCCPDHVVGNMNLRGNILTVVDIRKLLGVANGERRTMAKVIVAAPGNGLIGVAVDEVLDIAYLDPAEIAPLPLAGKSGTFIRGTAPYGGRMMTILDLTGALANEELMVDEET